MPVPPNQVGPAVGGVQFETDATGVFILNPDAILTVVDGVGLGVGVGVGVGVWLGVGVGVGVGTGVIVIVGVGVGVGVGVIDGLTVTLGTVGLTETV